MANNEKFEEIKTIIDKVDKNIDEFAKDKTSLAVLSDFLKSSKREEIIKLMNLINTKVELDDIYEIEDYDDD